MKLILGEGKMVLSLLILFNVFVADYGQSIGIILITSAHKFSFLFCIFTDYFKVFQLATNILKFLVLF